MTTITKKKQATDKVPQFIAVAGGIIADTSVHTTRGAPRNNFGLNQSARKRRPATNQ